jgi:diguanylate cyclase (GGDEF)-like protein
MDEPLSSEEISKLRELTIRDDLTGLYNRRHFSARLIQVKEESDREGEPFALLMVDLDDFKRINDTRGHLVGDQVLRRVADLLRESLRESDVPCRYGGDEFAVILPDADATGALTAAQSLLARMRSDAFVFAEMQVTLSIGVVTYPDIGGTVEEVFEAADRGLLAAKRAGKNALHVVTATAVAPPPRLGHTGGLSVSRESRFGTGSLADTLSGDSCIPRFDRFVGRADELKYLNDRFAAAEEGALKVVFVLGDPGMGKTHLVAAFRKRFAAHHDAYFLSGRFYEAGTAAAYQAFREGLAGLVGSMSDRGPWSVSAVFGALADRVGREIRDESRLDQQYQTLELYRLALSALAAVKPVILFIDDLQWADAASLELLGHLTRTAASERIMILATARRHDAFDDERPLRRWMRRLSRTFSVDQLELGPLSEEETRALLEAVFMRIVVPEHAVSHLYRETKGHPYFITETLRLLVEDGTISYADDWWHVDAIGDVRLPSTIVDLVELQLERLSAEELDLFSQASVLGQTFTFDLLARLSGFDEDRTMALLESGIRHSILREEIEGPDDAFSFYHSTVQRVLYHRLSRRRRRTLHKRAANLLEDLGRGSAELAFHCVRGEEYERALAHAVDAASAALRAYSTDEALRFFRWAVEAERALVGAQRSAAAVLGPERAVAFHVEYGCLLLSCGLMDEAEAELGGALARAEGAGLRILTARARTAVADLRRVHGAYDAAVESARAALDALAYDEGIAAERERSAAHLVLGDIYYRKGALPAAATEYSAGLEAARVAGDRAAEGHASRRLGLAHNKRGRFSDAERALLRALAIARETDDRSGEGRALNALANMYASRGELGRALAYFQQALKAARETGSREDEGIVLCNVGEVYRKQRQLERALDALRQALVVARELGDRRGEAINLLNIGLVHTEREQFQRALDRLGQATSVLREIGDNDVLGEALLATAVIHMKCDRFEEALVIGAEALEVIRVNEEPELEWRALQLIGECFAPLGRIADARGALSHAREIVEHMARNLPDDGDRAAFLADKQPLYEALEALDDAAGPDELQP